MFQGSLPSYLNWHAGLTMPNDTWLVAEHTARQGAARGPYYFAHKAATGWEFGASTADGWLLKTDKSCAGCHAEAPADFVFGFVRPPPSAQKEQRPDGG